MSKITMKELQDALTTAEFKKLKTVELDGSTDFNQVAEVLGLRDPNIVWPVINCIQRNSQGVTRAQPKLSKLLKG